MSDIKIYGEHEPKTLAQMQRCMTVGSAVKGVLCADGHLGYAHPIGGVVAYEEDISISGAASTSRAQHGVGWMRVTPTSRRARTILDDIGLDQLRRPAQCRKGRSRAVRLRPLGCCWCRQPQGDGATSARHRRIRQPLRRSVRGRDRLRVDRCAFRFARPRAQDYDQSIWSGRVRRTAWRSTRRWSAGDIGRSYIAGIELGGPYAYAGRKWVVERVRQIIGAAVTESVHNHHNFAWRETHGDRDLWVVRKGATPAFPGQRGFVGGSMGDDAVILEGVESEASAYSLYSTVHGAGRICGRMEAKGKKNKAGEWTRQPRFTRQQMDAWLQEKHVLLRGGDVDESPMAYRRPDARARRHISSPHCGCLPSCGRPGVRPLRLRMAFMPSAFPRSSRMRRPSSKTAGRVFDSLRGRHGVSTTHGWLAER